MSSPRLADIPKARRRVEAGTVAWLEKVLRPRAKAPVRDRKFGSQSSSPRDDRSVVGYDEITFDEAIGAGSFGAVWRGTCRGEVVAVKQCRIVEQEDTEMFLSEIGYLQKLRHPRLVPFLGCCHKFPHIVMLMEYLPNGSLYALLFQRKRRLEFSEQVRMASETAEGLTYLHNLNIVHRDLKTMNIVLTHELGCKICDFGLALTLERTHMTVKSFQGSPRYMAPEQLEAVGRISEKVDIWQMGCVMLELFCLVLPFAHCAEVQQIFTELVVRRRPPSAPSAADPRARVLLQACFRMRPQARPCAAALDQALRSVCGSGAEAEKALPCDGA